MTSPSAAAQVAKLTLPTQPPTPFPNVPSGCVWMYPQASWTTYFELRTGDYSPRSRHTLPNAAMNNTNYIAFNLPVGTVMTMTDNITHGSDSKPLADLANCWGTLDLVGNGQTKAIMLNDAGNLMDCISGFFWREVDLNQGALEIFANSGFTHNFATIFLSEWPRDQIHSLGGWWLNNKVSSIRWKSLNDRTQVTLYDGEAGNGGRYENVKGWGSFKEISWLGDVGFDNYTSAFKWTAVLPKKEIIDPITLSPASAANARSYTHEETGYNNTDQVGQSTHRITEQLTQTINVETTDIHQVGITTSASSTAKAGVEGVASTESTVQISFSYNYTNSQTVVKSDSMSTTIETSETFNKPTYSNYKATLVVTMGTLPRQEYQTKATRWYDTQIYGSVQDPSTNNWWKREETVTFMIGGSVRTSKQTTLDAWPLTEAQKASLPRNIT